MPVNNAGQYTVRFVRLVSWGWHTNFLIAKIISLLPPLLKLN
jgi:hypothetical protein